MTFHSEQDAIKQAVEAGYESNPGTGATSAIEFGDESAVIIYRDQDGSRLTSRKGVRIVEVLLDPAFWQALGKARGWQYSICDHIGCLRTFPCGCGNHSCACGQFHADPESPATWKYYALRYFETRLSNGDMQAFWQNLP